MLDHDMSRQAKKARPLVVGERCHVLGPGNKWIDAFITGITDSGRSYETQVEATGKQLTRNHSHIRPRIPDIPHMHVSRYLIISKVVVELNLWTYRRSMKTLCSCNFDLPFI